MTDERKPPPPPGVTRPGLARTRNTLSPGLIMSSLNEAIELGHATIGLLKFMKERHPELDRDPLPALEATAKARAEALEREGRRCPVMVAGARCTLERGHIGIHR